MASSLEYIATIVRRSAFMDKCNRANIGRNLVRLFRARWRFFSAWVVNYGEEITEAALPAWQAVEMFLPPLVSPPRTKSPPPET